MSYVDLTPKKTKIEEEVEPTTTTEDNSPTNSGSSFFNDFSQIGEESKSVSSSDEVLSLLKSLNEKIISVEDKLYKIERRMEERSRY